MKHMMKTICFVSATGMVMLFSCKKEAQPVTQGVPQSVKDQITALGFTSANAQKIDEGYLVEGDIIITPELLNSSPESQFLRVGNEEQYRTTNLVKSLPRTITVSLDRRIPSAYDAVLDEMVSRYNALNLQIQFQKVSSGGQIVFKVAHGSYLASSGFPSSTGAPYPTVNVNTTAITQYSNSTTFLGFAASIFAHEVGHCIGFRHTDYMNRSYSCGGSPVNEGASTVGAIQIPGTPAGPDPNSWMLSCVSAGQNRPFNANDKTALNYLY
jgi:hypothetical protein